MSTRTNINLSNKFISHFLPTRALENPGKRSRVPNHNLASVLIHAETYREPAKNDAGTRYAATQPERAASHCVVETHFRQPHFFVRRRRLIMRHLTLLVAGVLLVAASGNADAGFISPAGLSRIGGIS